MTLFRFHLDVQSMIRPPWNWQAQVRDAGLCPHILQTLCRHLVPLPTVGGVVKHFQLWILVHMYQRPIDDVDLVLRLAPGAM